MTNLITSPEDLTSSWNAELNITVTPNSDTAPDGAVTADNVSASSATDNALNSPTFSVDGSTDYITSLFVKKEPTTPSNYPLFGLRLSGVDPNKFGQVFIDTENGATSPRTGLGPDDSGVVEYPDYWEIWMKVATTANHTSGRVTLYPAAQSTFGPTYAATTGDAVFWGIAVYPGSALGVYTSQAGVKFPSIGGSPNLGLSFGKMGRMGAR